MKKQTLIQENLVLTPIEKLIVNSPVSFNSNQLSTVNLYQETRQLMANMKTMRPGSMNSTESTPVSSPASSPMSSHTSTPSSSPRGESKKISKDSKPDTMPDIATMRNTLKPTLKTTIPKSELSKVSKAFKPSDIQL